LNRLFFVILTALLLCFTAESSGDVVRVVSWVLDERDRPLVNALVYVYENDRQVDVVEANRRGRVIVDMEVNSNYVIEITAPGKVPKKFSFNTFIPQSMSGARGIGFEFVMDLFDNYPGLELELFDRVLLNFHFDPAAQGFSFDQDEYEAVFSEIEEAKVYIAELYNKKEEYDELVKRADRLYQEDKLEEALGLYKQAVDLDIPKETRAPDQVIAVSRKLGIPTEEDILQYEELIAKADNKFDNNEFEVAAGYYRDALAVIPDKAYPVDRINECERLITEMAIAEKAAEVAAEPEPEPLEEVIAEAKPVDTIVAEEKPKEKTVTEPEIIKETVVLEDEAEKIAEVVEKEPVETVKEPAVTEEEPDHVKISAPKEVFRRWSLTREQIDMVNEIAQRLQSDPNANLIIHSYVKRDNDKPYNFYLSKKQSTAVISRLLEKGVDINRLYQVSYIDAPGPNNASGNEDLQFELKYDQEFYSLVKNSHKNSLLYLDDLNSKAQFNSQVEFLVQFVAALNPVTPDYYKTIKEQLPEKKIYYYYGEKRMHHYSVGGISSLPNALEIHRDLRKLGYDTYIIALLDGNRVLTTEISELLNKK